MQCEVSLNTTTKIIDLNRLCEQIIPREIEKLEMIQSNPKVE